MTYKAKVFIHKANHFLNKPIAVVVVLVLMFAYFAFRSARVQSQNTDIIHNTSTTVSQLKRVLCEEVPDKQCNLSKAVVQIKADNTNQTILLCKLFLSGKDQLNDQDTAKIEAICNEQIKKLDHTTTASAGSSSTGGSKPASGSQKSSGTSPTNTAPSTSGSQGDNNHSSTPTPLLCINNTTPTLNPITGAQVCL